MCAAQLWDVLCHNKDKKKVKCGRDVCLAVL